MSDWRSGRRRGASNSPGSPAMAGRLEGPLFVIRACGLVHLEVLPPRVVYGERGPLANDPLGPHGHGKSAVRAEVLVVLVVVLARGAEHVARGEVSAKGRPRQAHAAKDVVDVGGFGVAHDGRQQV